MCVEHQVEGLSLGKRVASVWVLNAHFSDAFIELLSSVVLNILLKVQKLFPLFCILLLSKLLSNELLDELIGASWASCLRVHDHEI